jgi:hypothetical protein
MLCGLSVCDLGATTVLYFNVEYEYVAQGRASKPLNTSFPTNQKARF